MNIDTFEDYGVGFSPPPEGGLITTRTSRRNTCQNVPMMLGKNRAIKAAVLFQPRCKLWRCEDCAKINADLWIMRATYATHLLIEQGKPLDMVTITSHERLSPDQTIRILPHAWDKLRKRASREVGKLDYLAIPERHEDFRVHIHALVLCQLGKRWWKDNARACGLGYMAEDKPVYSAHGAGFYVGKYLTKQLKDSCWAKGFRRIRTSQNFPKLPPLERNEEWEFEIIKKHTAISEVFHKLRLHGYAVRLSDSKEAWQLIESGEIVNDLTTR